MPRRVLFFLALIFLFPSGTLHCDEVDDYFKLLDKNHDGKISREEGRLWAWPELQFKWKDLNNDGFVDATEFKTWLTSKSTRSRMLNLDEKTFAQMDSNGDGKISYREECWCNEDVFRTLDANGDGYLTRTEAFHKFIRPSKFKISKKRVRKR